MLRASLAGGPRPTDLPPTLQPHAIAAMAPATDRRLSGLMAGAIYALIAGSLALLAAVKPQVFIQPITTHPISIVDETRTPVQAKLVERETGGSTYKGSGTRPPDVDPLSASHQQQVSDTIPTHTQTQDLSQAFDPNLAIGKPGENNTGGDPKADPKLKGGGSGGTGNDAGAGLGNGSQDFAFYGISVLQQVSPSYPAIAKMSRQQGPVVLKMSIDASGNPTTVEVISGAPVFHQEAVRAAKQWRFTPAHMNGQTVPATFTLTLLFKLI
jgi:TonB family protein